MKKLYLILCLLLIPFVCQAGVVASGSVTQSNAKKSLVDGAAFFDLSTELVTDGEMEIDSTANWSQSNCTLAEESTIVHSGTKSLKITDNGASAHTYQAITTVVGKSYSFSYWFYRLSSNTGGDGYITILNGSHLGSSISGIAKYFSLYGDDAWIEINTLFVAESTTSVIKIAPDSTTGNIVYVDDISVQQTLSPYADADSGDHKHIFKLIDSAGKVAWGYVGTNGGGETLGSEVIAAADDRTFDSDTGYWYQATGWAITGGEAVATATTGKLERNILTYNVLYKAEYEAVVTSGTFSSQFGVNNNSTGSYTEYICAGSTYFWIDGGAAFTGTIDNITIKQVTDCSTNGLHILSTKSGSVQNWADVESGFHYNDPDGYTYEIKTIGKGAGQWW